ncbi:hypothetical protein BV25DRAFT_1281752 [Artomyces pyxidatus]|uniref:Uncharacterized protein n=1 Tax=Artomyces pyxidatus TaxID=48021 RepID=A0ACB8TFB0_9AGAM|nr:hypothetical protein BV25DRAFT_1281752 [Artomyces pyxidatus]
MARAWLPLRHASRSDGRRHDPHLDTSASRVGRRPPFSSMSTALFTSLSDAQALRCLTHRLLHGLFDDRKPSDKPTTAVTPITFGPCVEAAWTHTN